MAAAEQENGGINNGGKPKDPDKRTENQAVTETLVLDNDASETDHIDGAETECPTATACGASIGCSRSSCESRAVPPFLLKIYDMLQGNAETNSLVSWSSTGTSFTVMNPQLFASNVLPIYFKHSNFQSFITQLNSYGFKKISWKQWEYKNEYFRKGEKHLLKHIKRRNQSNSHRTRVDCSNSCSRNIEQELKLLKEETDLLKAEIKKLEEKQEILDEQVASLTYQAVNNQENKWRTIFATQTKLDEKNLKGKRTLEETSAAATDHYRIPTLCSDPGSCSAISMANIPERFIQRGTKMMLDEGETGKHQPNTFISLEDLIGESSEWVEYIRETQEKASRVSNLKLKLSENSYSN
ncbi:Heat stress transcription factor A-2e [Sesamum alatum]|uniref:Heat stress transcription factor A-2e n=1 Tax=Sesamum alatum TaxID=300844 RepID=A0AAE1YYV6_9LAMI|nr:Heat stress transcription factor A-2e [Sesamum alatum]